MRVIVLTANQLRHKYFACRVAEVFNVVGVFVEKKLPKISSKRIDKRDVLISRHFNDFVKTEKLFFEKYSAKNFFRIQDKVKILEEVNLNNSKVIQEIIELKPDCAIVLGTCILKDEIIDAIPKIINLHLGLSPYYRGSGTNFWPFFNKELKYLGVTVHFLDKGIDTGEIIHQGRPDIIKSDTIHSVGCKAINVGTDLIIKALNELKEKTIKSYPQKEGGQLYFRKHFTHDKIEVVYKLIEEGIIEKYVDSKNSPQNQVNIIS